MIGRRAMLLGGASLVAPTLVARGVAAGLPVPRGDSLAFRIMRHGSQIGTHTIAFERDGDVLTVHTAVDVLVTVLSIPLARYRHRGTETWQGTTLVGMVGETNKTGQRGWMSARYTNGALVVCSHAQSLKFVETQMA